MRIKTLILSVLLLAAPSYADNLKVRTGRDGKVISVENLAVSRKSSHPGDAKLSELRRAQSEIKGRSLAATAASSASDPIVTSDNFLATLAAKGISFGTADISSELFPQGVDHDNIGMKHVSYSQEVNGVPVFGAELRTHLNSKGEVVSVNGRTLDKKDIDTTPKLTSKEAEEIATALLEGEPEHKALLKHGKKVARKGCRKANNKTKCAKKKFKDYADTRGYYTGRVPKLYVYNDGFIGNTGDTPTHLVWEVVVTNLADDGKYVYVDAHSGMVVTARGIRQHIDRRIRDCSDPLNNDTCVTNLHIGFWGYTFGRTEGMPERGPNPMPAPFFGSTDVDDAYDMAGELHQYYFEKFGRNGGNNLGGLGNNGGQSPFTETQMLVHTDGNSFFLPYCASGGVASVGDYRTEFCVGSVVNDIFSHEYGHIVAKYRASTSGVPDPLLTTNEAGALLEGFADIMGEGFEFDQTTGGNDWLIGTGLPSGIIFRNLADPPSMINNVSGLPAPDNYFDDNFYCGSLDAGGVHINTTIPTKAAYLLAEGGSFNGCEIEQIGLDKVEQIWYRALNNYFIPSETFNGAYDAFIAACNSLYLPDVCDNVTNALQAVELDQPGGCGTVATPQVPACAGVTCSLSGSFTGI